MNINHNQNGLDALGQLGKGMRYSITTSELQQLARNQIQIIVDPEREYKPSIQEI